MSKIKQIYVSRSIRTFEKKIRSRYGLEEYSSINKPAIFFGCYPGSDDIPLLLKHKSLAVIVYGGGDALTIGSQNYKNKPKSKRSKIKRNLERYKIILKESRYKHIAISSFIKKDLEMRGIKPICLPICPSPLNDISYYSKEHSNIVYFYSIPNKAAFYGAPIFNEVKEKIKDKRIRFVNVSYNTYNRKELIELYKKTFIGLRLPLHDGLSNTVVELGLMGRRCVWNGNGLPNAIRWKNVNDIVDIIQKEYANRGKDDSDLSVKMKKYLEIGQDWLTEEYYGKG